MIKNYPAPDYNPQIVADWYKLIKYQSTCPSCQIMQPTNTRIEYHHLDRKQKCDTLSNMVHFKAPLADIMAETLKVMPLCQNHHVRYHQLERHGHTDLIKSLYDFDYSKYYRQAIEDFHAMAWLFAPKSMQGAYIEFMENGRVTKKTGTQCKMFF
jgi:hypothetical protein